MNPRVIPSTRFVTAGAALAVLLLAGPAGAQTRRLEKHFSVEGKPVVTVQNPSGRIQVKAWDKHEVMIVGEHAGNNAGPDAADEGHADADDGVAKERRQDADRHQRQYVAYIDLTGGFRLRCDQRPLSLR